MRSVWNRENAYDSVHILGERKMQKVKLDAQFDAATRGTETSIQLGTAVVAGVTVVSIDFLRCD